jgi:hydrogenase nickel incorporation protein HypB
MQKMANHLEIIKVEEIVMQENDRIACEVRNFFRMNGIYVVNLISSPGSGKTALLVETLKTLQELIPCAVIEGDQQTSNDAQRIAETGVPVVQVNTLHSCHLNALQIKKSLDHLPIEKIRLLFIENVGNLVCPANMDLGENEKIVLMSVTEGEDKPEKYPLAFLNSQLLIITKIDLLPYIKFDKNLCEKYARQINSNLEIIETSSYTREGISAWIDYLLLKAGSISQ